MNFDDPRLTDYLLPASEELEEFNIFDEDMSYAHREENTFYQEWP